MLGSSEAVDLLNVVDGGQEILDPAPGSPEVDQVSTVADHADDSTVQSGPSTTKKGVFHKRKNPDQPETPAQQSTAAAEEGEGMSSGKEKAKKGITF